LQVIQRGQLGKTSRVFFAFFEARGLLDEYMGAAVKLHPVNKAVGNIKYQGRECTEAI
jgi:hypothetical protein